MESSLPFEQSVTLFIHIFITLAMLCIGMSATLREMGAAVLEREKLTHLLALMQSTAYCPQITSC